MSKLSFNNKIVVITGASSGIGKALAEEFGRLGAKLSLCARNEEKLTAVSDNLKYQGIEVLAVAADVSIENDCKNFILTTYEKYGRIDVLINNAGLSMRALFANTELDVLHKLMDVNFWGTVNCTKYALPYLLDSKGSVAGISSIAGYKGLPGRTGYSASKFAMHGFLETLRIENRKTGLHVLIACPGFTTSNIRNVALSGDGSQQGESPLDEQKIMSAETVAKYILSAIAKRKHRLTLTTQGKLTVLLNKFFPRFMDKMVYNHMAKEQDSPLKS